MNAPTDGGDASDVHELCSHLGVALVQALGDGGEADLSLVEDTRGARYVLKHYRPGFTVDPGIHDRLRGINHTAVLRIHRTGVFQGRHFELTDYFADRSLADWWGRERLDEDALRKLVRHVGSGLDALHRAGIVHRDLKPANLLVHHDPLAPVIADFGVSRVQEHTQVLSVVEGTAYYEPPEAHEGVVSAAGDWWALGMIVYELATGAHPFAEHTDQEIVMTLAAWSPDVTRLPRPLWRLCEGLLTLDQQERWSWARVSAWLDGDERPARTRTVPAAGGTAGIRFADEVHTTKEGFADAIRENWGKAERRFLTDMLSAYGPSEGWSTLLEWLRQFRSVDDADSERLIDLIDRHLIDGDLEPSLKLLRLLRWLDPEGTPVFNGSPITIPKLVEACVGDLTGEQRPRTTAQRVLRDGKVQQLLADFPGLEPLRWLRAESTELARTWERILLDGDRLSTSLVRHKADTPGWTLKHLAALAGGENEALHRLADRSPAPPPEIRDVYDAFLREAADADEDRRSQGKPVVFVAMVKITFGHRGFGKLVLKEHGRLEHEREERDRLERDRLEHERRERERRDAPAARLVALQKEFSGGEQYRRSERAGRDAKKRFWHWYQQWMLPTTALWLIVSVSVPVFVSSAFFLLVLYWPAAIVGGRMRAWQYGAAYQPPKSLWKYVTRYGTYPKSPGRTVPLWVTVPLMLITMLATAVEGTVRDSVEGAPDDVILALVAALWLANTVVAVVLGAARRAWNEDHLRYVADFRASEHRLLAALPPHLRDLYHPVPAPPGYPPPPGRRR